VDNDQALPGEQFNDFVDHPLPAEEDRPFLHLERPQARIRLGRPSGGEQPIRDKDVVVHRESAADAAR
jgi:hypothetical protein